MSGMLKRLIAGLKGDTIVRLADLPESLREPLNGFIRPNARFVTLAQLHQAYAQAAQLLKARAWLYEQEATTAQAATALQLTRAMTAFVSTLTPEQRALLQLQTETRARFDFERLEDRNAEVERELTHYRQLTYDPPRN
jgi:hypothetical protein